MTSRRGFLASLAAALVLDPERALWVPGAKLISIPKPRLVPPIDFDPWFQVAFKYTPVPCPPDCPACIHAANLVDEMLADLYKGLTTTRREVALIDPDGTRRVVPINV